MIARSKRYKNSVKDLSPDEELSLTDALGRLGGFGKANFDETVELSFSLDVDPKQSSLAVRGTVNLPNGSGKEIRVLVFTEKPDEALSAGADIAGLDDLISKIIGHRSFAVVRMYQPCIYAGRAVHIVQYNEVNPLLKG